MRRREFIGLLCGSAVVSHPGTRAQTTAVKLIGVIYQGGFYEASIDKVDLIVAITTTAALAGKRATEKVPIVFAAGADPVAAGLVDSIAVPGGRLTGFHFLTSDLTAKRLEILRDGA